MPEAAKPKPLPPAPHGFVQTAGVQEDHLSAATELAAALGWKGEASWVANDIAVSDAVAFVAKTLHEHFIAGAKDEERPSHLAACEHLAISDTAEQAAVDAALFAAFEAGKGSEVSHHPIVHALIGKAS